MVAQLLNRQVVPTAHGQVLTSTRLMDLVREKARQDASNQAAALVKSNDRAAATAQRKERSRPANQRLHEAIIRDRARDPVETCETFAQRIRPLQVRRAKFKLAASIVRHSAVNDG